MLAMRAASPTSTRRHASDPGAAELVAAWVGGRVGKALVPTRSVVEVAEVHMRETDNRAEPADVKEEAVARQALSGCPLRRQTRHRSTKP